MEYTLEIINGNYRETKKWFEQEQLHNRRTNSKKRITHDMQALTTAVTQCVVGKEDLKMYYESGDILILKDYKKNAKKYLLFREKITQLTQHEDVIVIRRDKVHAINKRKIAAILLAGSMALSMTNFVTSKNKSATEYQKQEIVTEQYYGPDIIKSHAQKMSTAPFNNIAAQIEEIVFPEEIVIEPEQSLEERLENIKQLQEGLLSNSNLLPIGTRLTPYALNRLINFINSTNGGYAFKYGEQFGVDPYILICIAMQESSLTASAYNGYAYGLYQLESPETPRTVTAINVLTGEKETMKLTVETAKNPETNTKIAAMMLQNYLTKFNHNIYLAIQSYNYGPGMVNLAISKYADRVGVPKDIVISNYEDFGWLEDIQAIHDHPHEYVTEEDREKYQDTCGATIRYLDNWPFKTYGDGKYIEHVLSYYIGTVSEIKSVDKTTVVSLITNQAQQTQNPENSHLLS